MTPRSLLFHPLIVLLFSITGAATYGIYAGLHISRDKLFAFDFYVLPIIVPFVAFLFDRAERFRQLTLLQFALDALVVGTAMWRVIGNVPFISGHTLFLTYAFWSTRSRVTQFTAAIVMVQVVYLKYFVWHDWITSTVGILLGSLAAFITWRMEKRRLTGLAKASS